MIPSLNVSSPAPRDIWHSLMDADPEAMPYQSPAWLDSVCASGKYADASRLYEADDGRQFILPMVRRRRLPAWLKTAGSLPSGWGMGGLVASGRVDAENVRAVFDDLARLPFARIVVRPNPRLGQLWAAAAPVGVTAISRMAHVLDLEGGFEHVWSKRFNKNTRSAVRKSEESGVVVESDTTGILLPVFYDLLVHSFDRWSIKQHEPRFLTRLRGTMRDPIGKFEAIRDRMGDACRVWVAFVGGKPAAAIMVLQCGNANYTKAAMNRELVGLTQANVLLLKIAIEEACRGGCRYFHMGETGNSKSLAQFKRRFGATAYDYSEYYLEKLPLTRIDTELRRAIKWTIGFKDAE